MWQRNAVAKNVKILSCDIPTECDYEAEESRTAPSGISYMETECAIMATECRITSMQHVYGAAVPIQQEVINKSDPSTGATDREAAWVGQQFSVSDRVCHGQPVPLSAEYR